MYAAKPFNSLIATRQYALTPPPIRSASIENLKSFDPFAEADEGEGGDKQSQNYIHIRIQRESIHNHHPQPWRPSPPAPRSNTTHADIVLQSAMVAKP